MRSARSWRSRRYLVMGRPYLAPPGVRPATVAALRRAFMATMADKDFLADAERSKLEITPVSGDGPALPGAAGRAACDRRGAAPRLHGNDGRQGLSRRCGALEAGDHAGIG